MSDITNKPLKNAGLTELINKIKTNLIHRSDITTTTLIDVDTTPTSSSTNLVTSGGVKTALDTKVSDVKIDGTSIVTSGVANIPEATSSQLGVVKVDGDYGIDNSSGVLKINPASDSEIDDRDDEYKPIVPCNLEYAVRSVRPNWEFELPTSPERIVVNQIYDMGAYSGTMSILLPTLGIIGDFIQIDFLATDAINLSIAGTTACPVSDWSSLTITPNKIYTLFFDYGIVTFDDPSAVYGWRFSYAEYEYTPSV